MNFAFRQLQATDILKEYPIASLYDFVLPRQICVTTNVSVDTYVF